MSRSIACHSLFPVHETNQSHTHTANRRSNPPRSIFDALHLRLKSAEQIKTFRRNASNHQSTISMWRASPIGTEMRYLVGEGTRTTELAATCNSSRKQCGPNENGMHFNLFHANIFAWAKKVFMHDIMVSPARACLVYSLEARRRWRAHTHTHTLNW